MKEKKSSNIEKAVQCLNFVINGRRLSIYFYEIIFSTQWYAK